MTSSARRVFFSGTRGLDSGLNVQALTILLSLINGETVLSKRIVFLKTATQNTSFNYDI